MRETRCGSKLVFLCTDMSSERASRPCRLGLVGPFASTKVRSEVQRLLLLNVIEGSRADLLGSSPRVGDHHEKDQRFCATALSSEK